MKLKQTLLALIFLFASQQHYACLNGETRILKNGFVIYEDMEGAVPNGHQFELANAELLLTELDRLYNTTADPDYLSDKGYVLVVLQRYDEALKLYKHLETISPGRYSTASNLGTIYELIGDNQQAYNWIKRSVQIDPGSHKGSEWLHLNILQAKIKGEAFYTTDFLLKTTFGPGQEPVSSLSLSYRQQMAQDLYYQLNERMSFIKDEDLIMAVLLSALGNLYWLSHEFGDASETFKLAKRYGMDPIAANSRIEQTDFLYHYQLLTERNHWYTLNDYHRNVILWLSILAAAAFLLSAVLAVRLYRKIQQ